MISPHLLKVVESFSTNGDTDREHAEDIARTLWIGDRSVFFIETKNKEPKWCHMVLARGPALNEGAEYSELVIIWWSEMGPDTERVLSAIDWEKHADDIVGEAT